MHDRYGRRRLAADGYARSADRDMRVIFRRQDGYKIISSLAIEKIQLNE